MRESSFFAVVDYSPWHMHSVYDAKNYRFFNVQKFKIHYKKSTS